MIIVIFLITVVLVNTQNKIEYLRNSIYELILQCKIMLSAKGTQKTKNTLHISAVACKLTWMGVLVRNIFSSYQPRKIPYLCETIFSFLLHVIVNQWLTAFRSNQMIGISYPSRCSAGLRLNLSMKTDLAMRMIFRYKNC